MRRIAIVSTCVLAALAGLAVLGWVAVDTANDRWAWRRADLDGNRIALGHFRGARTGDELAKWVENGEVVATGATSVTVRYDRGEPGAWDVELVPRDRLICYRFARNDSTGDIPLDRVDCP